LIDNSKSELTPPRNSTTLSRNVKIMKRKQMHSTEGFKKKLRFSASEFPQSFSLINLHKHLLGCTPTMSHGAEADSLALLRITAVLGEKWLAWVKNNCFLFSETKRMWGN
jgi:hypothetical protein